MDLAQTVGQNFSQGARLGREFRQGRKKIRHFPDIQSRAGQMVRLSRSQRPDTGGDHVGGL
ncbi:MAG: hypothetical protein HOH89_05550 [Alphaproteobacteria bacterium]|nr:hypothetical protein [Alphaproteobacteria bacterium]MBT5860598.1 hypothetical protein [Alphaproteobacteria bacterium]